MCGAPSVPHINAVKKRAGVVSVTISQTSLPLALCYRFAALCRSSEDERLQASHLVMPRIDGRIDFFCLLMRARRHLDLLNTCNLFQSLDRHICG